MKTYLFYDLETSGLNKCFDQVLQFAAIRTDLDLNEIERKEILVKLNSDVVPAPGAVITHYLSPEATAHGENEFSALEEIHKMLNKPGTISLGYNTMTFDDEFLRFSFYKNLLTPYTHQFANQCGRMDIYPIAIFFYLFKNSVLKWPEINGRPSMKLENINALNDFFEGQAHDAMVDVEVTVRLAKALQQERSMWDWLCGYFDKRTDRERFDKLPTAFDDHRMGLYIEGKVGARFQYQAPVLDLGEHRQYKNQRVLLRLDQTALQEVTADNIDEKTWSLRKKFGESGFILPMEDRFLNHFKEERMQILNENLKFLEANPGLLKDIIEYHTTYEYDTYPDTDIDAALYINGFMSNSDIASSLEFHQSNNKTELIDTFQDPIYQDIALRICGRHFYDELNTDQKKQFDEYRHKALHEIIIDFKGEPKLTAEKALQEIDTLLAGSTLNEKQKGLLNNLKSHLQKEQNIL